MGLLQVIVHWLLLIFLLLLGVRAVLSLIPVLVRDWEPRGGLSVMSEFVLTLTDPPIRFLGRFLPPARVGGVVMDTGFLALFAVVAVASWWV